MAKTPEKKSLKNERNIEKNDGKTGKPTENKARDLRVKYKFMQEDVWKSLTKLYPLACTLRTLVFLPV